MTASTVPRLPTRFRVRELLTEAGLTHRELATQAGISLATVWGMLNNKSATVALRTLDSVSTVLSAALGRDVQPGDLLERVDE
jgi:DNA-binding Xre family transcriptional regulator